MKSQIGKSESFLELSALETETNIWMTDLNETESVIIKKSEEIRSSSLSFKSLMEESIRAEQQTRIIKEPYIGYVVAIFLAFAVVAVGFVRLMFVEIQSKAHFEMPSKRMTSINPNKELKSNSVTVNDTKPVLNLPKAEEKCDEGHAGYEGDGEWYEEDGEWYEEDGEWYEEDEEWYEEDGEWYVGEEAV
jgi:hypothetical protein